MENAKLTPKQKRFCEEYIIDLNATQAAIRTGYSEKTANEQASRLLANVKISEYIKQLMDERGKRTQITADRVLQELEYLGMFDPIHFIDVRNPQDIADLPEEVRRAIIGWSWDKRGNFVLEFAKVKGVELLGRHHKLFTDKIDVSGKLTLEELVAGSHNEGEFE